MEIGETNVAITLYGVDASGAAMPTCGCCGTKTRRHPAANLCVLPETNDVTAKSDALGLEFLCDVCAAKIAPTRLRQQAVIRKAFMALNDYADALASIGVSVPPFWLRARRAAARKFELSGDTAPRLKWLFVEPAGFATDDESLARLHSAEGVSADGRRSRLD